MEFASIDQRAGQWAWEQPLAASHSFVPAGLRFSCGIKPSVETLGYFRAVPAGLGSRIKRGGSDTVPAPLPGCSRKGKLPGVALAGSLNRPATIHHASSVKRKRPTGSERFFELGAPAMEPGRVRWDVRSAMSRQGQFENSPAFQRWVLAATNSPVPQGRKKTRPQNSAFGVRGAVVISQFGVTSGNARHLTLPRPILLFPTHTFLKSSEERQEYCGR